MLIARSKPSASVAPAASSSPTVASARAAPVTTKSSAPGRRFLVLPRHCLRDYGCLAYRGGYFPGCRRFRSRRSRLTISSSYAAVRQFRRTAGCRFVSQGFRGAEARDFRGTDTAGARLAPASFRGEQRPRDPRRGPSAAPKVALLEARMSHELARLVEKHRRRAVCVPALEEVHELDAERAALPRRGDRRRPTTSRCS